MPDPGRNDPCPCGSGKKFKQCCALKQHRMSPALIVALVAVVVVTVIAIVSSVRRSPNDGLVWSPAHGHYHDASGREVGR